MSRPLDRRGVIELSHPVDLFLRVGARVLLTIAIGAFTIVLLSGNLPTDPDAGALTQDVLAPLQIGLLVVTGVGLLLSFRSMAAAAVATALGGTGVAVISALQYEAPTPVSVAVAVLAPAVMMWLDWQHRETLAKIVLLAEGTATMLTVAWFGSAALYDHFFGPTHPESSTPALPSSLVEWAWSGAVDAEGFTVVAVLDEPADDLEMVVTARESGGEVFRSAPVAAGTGEPVRVAVDGLEPDTDYRYVFESSGVADEVRAGEVTTFPAAPSSLTLAFGSCARTGSNGAVFDAIREVDPDLYAIVGDLHYRNIADDDPARFAAAYGGVHSPPAQAQLYREVPIAYVWDDHDFGPNDSDSTSPSRPAAWQSYRDFVPHYELPSGETGGVHQAFTIGRVRIVMLDTRSYRVASDGVILGEEQLGWLFGELLAARDTHALTILVSSTPWIGPAEVGADHWGGFAAERDRIGAFLADHTIENLVVVGGDAHMVAIDDGTNSGYGGHGGVPLLQAAALDRPGSVKGGPYSGGTFPGGGQFGVVEVTDTGVDTIGVELRGMNWEGDVLTRLTTTLAVP